MTKETKQELFMQGAIFASNILVQILSQYGETALNEDEHSRMQQAVREIQDISQKIRFKESHGR